MRRYLLPFLLLIVLAAGLLWIPDATWAQTGAAPQPDPASYELFPNESSALGDYRQYIRAFYQFSIAAGILIATVLIMIGGMIWVTSAGNPGRIDKAKSYIIDSIIGVILLISAYTILQVLNPNLVALPDIKSRLIIGNVGACVYQMGSKSYCRMTTNDDCTKPNSSQTAAGITAGTYSKNLSCADTCTPNTDGSCSRVARTSDVLSTIDLSNIQSCLSSPTSDIFAPPGCKDVEQFLRNSPQTLQRLQSGQSLSEAEIQNLQQFLGSSSSGLACVGKIKSYAISSTDSTDALLDCTNFCKPCSHQIDSEGTNFVCRCK